jgi:hypothetical protein
MGRKRFTKSKLLSENLRFKITEEANNHLFFEIGSEITTDIAEAVAIMMRTNNIEKEILNVFNKDHGLNGKFISSLTKGNNGDVFIGTSGDGLNVMNFDSKSKIVVDFGNVINLALFLFLLLRLVMTSLLRWNVTYFFFLN